MRANYDSLPPDRELAFLEYAQAMIDAEAAGINAEADNIIAESQKQIDDDLELAQNGLTPYAMRLVTDNLASEAEGWVNMLNGTGAEGFVKDIEEELGDTQPDDVAFNDGLFLMERLEEGRFQLTLRGLVHIEAMQFDAMLHMPHQQQNQPEEGDGA